MELSPKRPNARPFSGPVHGCPASKRHRPFSLHGGSAASCLQAPVTVPDEHVKPRLAFKKKKGLSVEGFGLFSGFRADLDPANGAEALFPTGQFCLPLKYR